MTRESLDSLFDSVADEQRMRADADDANPDLQARIASKRQQEIARDIRAGLRHENGDWIEISDDTED